MHYSTKRHEYVNDGGHYEDNCNRQGVGEEKWLCIFLGIFLSLFGVLIAAIVAKGYGVRKSFLGIFIRWAVMAVLALIVVFFQSVAISWTSSSSNSHINKWDENGVRIE